MAVTALLSACGDDNNDTCTLGSNEGCENGNVCEEVVGGEPACFAPARIEGRVFDLGTEAGIEGARIVALDPNGAARSSVAVSGLEGAYDLAIHIPRDADGNPVSESVTLRVSAQRYEPFPKAPRTAIPVDLATATFDDSVDEWVVSNAATDVGLLPIEGDTSGFGSVSGDVEVEGEDELDGGVLVIAEVGGVAVSTAITDESGSFVLFNVPEGDVTITAYRAGIVVEAETVSVTAGADTGDVLLSGSTSGLGTVSGTVNIVNAPGGSVTTVILIVKSTFESLITGSLALELTFLRGDAPAGLRADGVTGAYTIEGVPPGEYVVLGAFENDDLVRDPDTGQGGTDIVEITVGAGETVNPTSFKITEALAVFEPGAVGIDVIANPTPTFVWARDPSVEGYELRLFNAFGELVWEDLDVPAVTGTDRIERTYDGPALEEGMIYQFRTLSFVVNSSDMREYRSATEDLKGVFQFDTSAVTADGGMP